MHPKFILKNHTSPHSFQTRLGSWILTGSPGHPGQFFFNQNDVILVKKTKNKSQRVATGFLTGSCRVCRVTLDFFFPCFSLTRPGSSPESPARLGQGFKTMVHRFNVSFLFFWGFLFAKEEIDFEKWIPWFYFYS